MRLPIIQVPVLTPEPVKKPCVIQDRRILIVDDNVGAAHLLAMLLARLNGHAIETAYDGPSALAKIKEIHPEIVLLDIGLPGMNGYQVARSIREVPDYNDVLLVALTSYGQAEDRRKSKEAGFDVHLIKPPSVDQIKEILAHPKLAK